MKSATRALLVAGLIASLLTGCNELGVRETLDEKTLVSVIIAEPPLNFFRLRLDGEFERELVSVGVAELIASTERDTVLWINVWATRPDGSHGSVVLEAPVILEADGQTMTLRRIADDHTGLNLSTPPYRVMRAGEGEAYFALSANQLRALRDAQTLALQSGPHHYELWGDQVEARQVLSQFADELLP